MSRGRLWLLAAFAGASAAIVVGTHYLPMNDASNHMAAGVIFDRQLHGDVSTARDYHVLPIPVPYWATTLGMVTLLPLVGPFAALALVVAAYVVALPLAHLALLRTAAPENQGLAAVAALAAFNWAYWNGETNYLLGQPVVLGALALFLGLSHIRSARFLAFGLAVAALYICHIYALAELSVAVGALVGLDLAARRRRLTLAHWAGLAWLAAAFLLAAYFVLFEHHTASNRGALVFEPTIGRLVHVGIDPFDSRASPRASKLALLLVAAVAGALVAPWLGRLRREGRAGLAQMVNVDLLVPALALLAVTLLGPVKILGPDGGVREREIAERFGLPAFLLALGAVRLRPDRRWGAVVTAALVLFGTVKIADSWHTHRRHDAQIAEVSRVVLTHVPEGARVLAVKDLARHDDVDNLSAWVVNYVVVERHAYSPCVYDVPGQQALRHVRPEGYRDFADHSIRDAEWREFDYVLVQTDRAAPQIPGLAERARLVTSAGGFELYRICAAGGASPGCGPASSR